MPTIAYLFGIKIMMYSDDHNPPHIHVLYSGESAIYDLVNVTLIKGSIPSRQDGIVRSFIAQYKNELLSMWNSRTFKKIQK